MAFILRPGKDENEFQARQSGEPSGVLNTAAAPAANTNNGNNPAGTPLNQTQRSSGSFTNLQKYLSANQGQGNSLAKGVTSDIQAQGAAAQRDISSAADQFNKQSKDAQDSTFGAADQAKIDTYFSNPAANTNNDVGNRVKALTTASYTGPSGIDVSDIQSRLQKLRQRTDDLTTEAGRTTELQNTYNKPTYTSGQQKLDQLLLQSDGTQPQGYLYGTKNDLETNLYTQPDKLRQQAADAATAATTATEQKRQDLIKRIGLANVNATPVTTTPTTPNLPAAPGTVTNPQNNPPATPSDFVPLAPAPGNYVDGSNTGAFGTTPSQTNTPPGTTPPATTTPPVQTNQEVATGIAQQMFAAPTFQNATNQSARDAAIQQAVDQLAAQLKVGTGIARNLLQPMIDAYVQSNPLKAPAPGTTPPGTTPPANTPPAPVDPATQAKIKDLQTQLDNINTFALGVNNETTQLQALQKQVDDIKAQMDAIRKANPAPFSGSAWDANASNMAANNAWHKLNDQLTSVLYPVQNGPNVLTTLSAQLAKDQAQLSTMSASKQSLTDQLGQLQPQQPQVNQRDQQVQQFANDVMKYYNYNPSNGNSADFVNTRLSTVYQNPAGASETEKQQFQQAVNNGLIVIDDKTGLVRLAQPGDNVTAKPNVNSYGGIVTSVQDRVAQAAKDSDAAFKQAQQAFNLSGIATVPPEVYEAITGTKTTGPQQVNTAGLNLQSYLKPAALPTNDKAAFFAVATPEELARLQSYADLLGQTNQYQLPTGTKAGTFSNAVIFDGDKFKADLSARLLSVNNDYPLAMNYMNQQIPQKNFIVSEGVLNPNDPSRFNPVTGRPGGVDGANITANAVLNGLSNMSTTRIQQSSSYSPLYIHPPEMNAYFAQLDKGITQANQQRSILGLPALDPAKYYQAAYGMSNDSDAGWKLASSIMGPSWVKYIEDRWGDPPFTGRIDFNNTPRDLRPYFLAQAQAHANMIRNLLEGNKVTMGTTFSPNQVNSIQGGQRAFVPKVVVPTKTSLQSSYDNEVKNYNSYYAQIQQLQKSGATAAEINNIKALQTASLKNMKLYQSQLQDIANGDPIGTAAARPIYTM
jgi:hypothetical protein